MTPFVNVLHAQSKRPAFCFRHLKILTLLLFVFIMFFYRLGSYPLFDLDEPRYAEAAREMLEKGNWITPYFNYELRFDKPILFYWLVAWAYKIFGMSEFSARFFSAVAATLIVLMLYLFGRHWISKRAGFFASLILATCLMFIGIARMSITDMTLTCWMTGALLCLFMAAHQNLKWWLGAGIFAGLAVLTKGPVGLVVPGGIFCVYTLLIGDFKRCLLNRWMPMAAGLCLAIALPWYYLAYQENGKIFLDALVKHNVTRYSDTVSGHKQPVYFYIVVLLAGFMPWTFYLPASLKRLCGHFRHAHSAYVQNRDSGYLIALYAFVWVVFVLLFFTFGHTKLLTYILPIFPALALLVGETWAAESLESVNTSVKPKRQFLWPSWLLLGVVLAGGLLFIFNMQTLLPREAQGISANGYNILVVSLMVLGCGLTVWLLARKKTAMALLAQSATMALVLVFSLQGIIPNVSQATQGVMMEFLQKSGQEPLLLYEIQRPSLTFYGKRKVPRFVEEDRPVLLQELHRNKRTFVITKTDYVPDFNRLLPRSLAPRILEKGPVYSLLSVSQTP
jgi:4-amino-4-deoxy-L-arabinose transferase-like glycosyltransferase